jgi:hypothetical protein
LSRFGFKRPAIARTRAAPGRPLRGKHSRIMTERGDLSLEQVRLAFDDAIPLARLRTTPARAFARLQPNDPFLALRSQMEADIKMCEELLAQDSFGVKGTLVMTLAKLERGVCARRTRCRRAGEGR